MSETAGIAFLTFVASVCLVELTARTARRLHWFDLPNDRSSHQQATPRLGGAGVIAALVIACPLAGIGVSLGVGPRGTAIAAGALALALLGGIDDLKSLPTSIRMLIQLAIAVAVVVVGGVRLPLPLPPSIEPAISMIFAVGWLTWVTNLYNFMDGSDGLAGSQGLVASIAFAVALQGAAPALSAALVLLTAAIAGFLLHNMSPARIFMGDSMSTTLGFVFGALGLIGPTLDPVAAPLPLGLLAIEIFVFDATFTLVRRMLAREKWWGAHRSHAYQVLLQTGWSHRDVQLLYTAMAAATAGFGVCWSRLPQALALGALGAVQVALFVAALAIRRRWRRAQSAAPQP